jgi:glycosyltransferase involved in cell wall biosynthesis
MTEPLVSVKMITFNHAPYIAQAIEGVLNQKVNFPIELVIGEDCSTDGTREIVFNYQKKYPNIIRVITSENNVGMKKNSYRTTKACRGKYVAFCEGDDYWHRLDKLQIQVEYMEAHPECGLLHSSYDVYDVVLKKKIRDCIKYKGFEIPQKADIIDIIDGCRVSFRIQTCTVMVKRSFYEKIVESDPCLHQSNHYLMGDTQIWAELAVISELAYIPESLATYRLLEKSASRTKDPKESCRFEISDSEMKIYLCDKYKLPEHVRRKREIAWCESSLRLAFHERNGDLARQVLEKKRNLGWKEWLWYYGARNSVVFYACHVAILFRNLLRKEEMKF